MTYETVAGVNALATMLFGYLYDAVSVEVGGGWTQIDGEWRAQGMLRVSVRIRVDIGGANAGLGSCSSNTAAHDRLSMGD